MPKTHSVKSWPEFYAAVKSGNKPFELRKNDRNYQVGDILELCEYDDRKGKHTGEKMRFLITYVTTTTGPGAITPFHGLIAGYCILGLGDVPHA